MSVLIWNLLVHFIAANGSFSYLSLYRQQAQLKKHPQKPCFIFEDQTWTFQQVDEYTNQVANFFYEAGYRKGDSISIFMENRPEFVCFWLGLSKIGVVSALINFNLRQEPLAHCVNTAEAKALIFGGELSEG